MVRKEFEKGSYCGPYSFLMEDLRSTVGSVGESILATGNSM
jgi:hypothetical protein